MAAAVRRAVSIRALSERLSGGVSRHRTGPTPVGGPSRVRAEADGGGPGPWRRSVRRDAPGAVRAVLCQDRSMAKLVLDLHDIYNKGAEIDRALRSIIDEAVAKRIDTVEIIPGKGSGQLKKKVLRFLDQKEIKALYHRVDKDSKNFGRLFVYFRHDQDKRKSRKRR
jgi:DNA-nicking Smr family endonuclease